MPGKKGNERSLIGDWDWEAESITQYLLYNCCEIKRCWCDSVGIRWNIGGRLGHAGLQTSFDFVVLIEFTKSGIRFAFMSQELEGYLNNEI